MTIFLPLKSAFQPAFLIQLENIYFISFIFFSFFNYFYGTEGKLKERKNNNNNNNKKQQKTKTRGFIEGFLHSIGYLNCTKYHIRLDLLLILAHVRLPNYQNC